MASPASERLSSALEFLEQLEEREIEALKEALVGAGEDLCELVEVRELVRRQPELAVAASTIVGALSAPLVMRLAGSVLPALSRFGRKRFIGLP